MTFHFTFVWFKLPALALCPPLLHQRELWDVGTPPTGRFFCWFLSLHNKWLIQLQFSYGKPGKQKSCLTNCNFLMENQVNRSVVLPFVVAEFVPVVVGRDDVDQ